jgi:hypothetical protein
MRSLRFIGFSLLCLTLSAILIIRCRKSIAHGRGKAAAAVEILLIGGLHANEACAPLMAREVFRKLSDRGVRVALYEVPYPYTLLALVDDPATAVTDYSMSKGGRRLDVDLDGLDEHLRRHYPEALIFEFHNSEDTHPMLGIDPGKPVQEYEVGSIGPGSVRPYEIGTWRNLDSGGQPGKYLIEVPACYAPVGSSVRERRRHHLSQLREAGYDYDPRWSHYLESVVDVEASRRKGYLNDCLAQRIADWIISHREFSTSTPD